MCYISADMEAVQSAQATEACRKIPVTNYRAHILTGFSVFSSTQTSKMWKESVLKQA